MHVDGELQQQLNAEGMIEDDDNEASAALVSAVSPEIDDQINQNASGVEKGELASSDDAGVDRRELDENIAYVVKTDEDSYADQIASNESHNVAAADREESFIVKSSADEGRNDHNATDNQQDNQIDL